MRRAKNPESRNCVCCKKKLVRRRGEQSTAFRRRMYCNLSCRYECERKATDASFVQHDCQFCGVALVPGVYPTGKREGPKAFNRRRYCSQACAARSDGQKRRRSIPPRPCMGCGELMYPQPWERRFAFLNRKYHGQRCRPTTATVPHKCVACDSPVLRNKSESAKAYNRRRLCSKTCVGLSQRIAEVPHNCNSCGQALTRRQDEIVPHFNKRKYCDGGCIGRVLMGARKPCAACGVSFGPKKSMRTQAHFARQKYCSKACAYSMFKEANTYVLYGHTLTVTQIALLANVDRGKMQQRLRMMSPEKAVLLRGRNRRRKRAA